MEPVAGQEDNAADQANEEEEGEGGRVVLELEVNIGDDGEEEGEQQAANQNGEDNADENGHNQNGNGGERHVHRILGDDDLIATGGSIGQTVLGALAFPAVSAAMGGLLSFALPKSWMTDANWMNGRPGLLRNKWGRSVVGGCLFVVLKDALVLYCRWRMVHSHRQRKIMDYDKVAKKYVL